MDERLRETLSTYESVADRYATIHGDRDRVADIVESFLAVLDGQRVLDVGCGPGWESATFAAAGLDAVGLDLTRSFLADACDRAPTAAFLRADMRSLPLADDAFDGVWACASLLHVPREDVPATLREFRRVLVDGGCLAVSVKRADVEPEPGSHYANDRRHFERYTPDELAALVTDAGFTIAERRTSDRWLFVAAEA
jgi:ubiquinone/menaquinone biosynthesis C-methylase UbiE